MFDPIVAFFQRVFTAIGRGIGLAVAWLLWPFVVLGNWYRARSWVIKGPIALILLGLVLFYGYFVWQTQAWTNFDPDYVDRYKLAERKTPAGSPVSGPGATTGQSGAAATATRLPWPIRRARTIRRRLLQWRSFRLERFARPRPSSMSRPI